MSRDLDTGLRAEIAEQVIRPFFAIHIDLPDPVYAWTGVGSAFFDDADGISQEWTGVGDFGALDAISEASDGSASGIRVKLLKVPSEFRDDIADQAVRGALFEVYFGALNDTYTEVDAVQLVWKGRVDEYKITDSGTEISVEIVAESRAIDQRRPSIKRFTHEYQIRKHPGDLFFQYVPQMVEVGILWAKKEQSISSAAVVGAGGGGGGWYLPEPL